jgi:hypothetical protein
MFLRLRCNSCSQLQNLENLHEKCKQGMNDSMIKGQLINRLAQR